MHFFTNVTVSLGWCEGGVKDSSGVKMSRDEIMPKDQALLSCVSGSAMFCPSSPYIPSTLCPGSSPGFCNGNCKSLMEFWQLVFLPAIGDDCCKWNCCSFWRITSLSELILLRAETFHAKPCNNHAGSEHNTYTTVWLLKYCWKGSKYLPCLCSKAGYSLCSPCCRMETSGFVMTHHVV